MEKKKILESIIKEYKDDLNVKNIDENFYFDTPGNIIKYLLILHFINKNYRKFVNMSGNAVSEVYKDPQFPEFPHPRYTNIQNPRDFASEVHKDTKNVSRASREKIQ